MYVTSYVCRDMKNEPHIPTTYDALQVFTLVILKARLVTQDALRELLSYKLVINCSQAVFATTNRTNLGRLK